MNEINGAESLVLNHEDTLLGEQEPHPRSSRCEICYMLTADLCD